MPRQKNAVTKGKKQDHKSSQYGEWATGLATAGSNRYPPFPGITKLRQPLRLPQNVCIRSELEGAQPSGAYGSVSKNACS
jgi:hypothetical protein